MISHLLYSEPFKRCAIDITSCIHSTAVFIVLLASVFTVLQNRTVLSWGICREQMVQVKRVSSEMHTEGASRSQAPSKDQLLQPRGAQVSHIQGQ